MTNDIYDAPESEVESEPVIAFGGWLQFFRIINILSVVLSILSALLIAGVYFFVGDDTFSRADLLGLVELIPAVIFPYLIVRKIKERGEATPNKIKTYLGWDLSASFLAAVVVFYFYKSGLVEDKPYPIFLSIIYYFIWAAYFKRSKRVKAYYGSNAL